SFGEERLTQRVLGPAPLGYQQVQSHKHRAQRANAPQSVLVEHLGVTQEVELLQGWHALAQLLQAATERADVLSDIFTVAAEMDHVRPSRKLRTQRDKFE